MIISRRPRSRVRPGMDQREDLFTSRHCKHSLPCTDQQQAESLASTRNAFARRAFRSTSCRVSVHGVVDAKKKCKKKVRSTSLGHPEHLFAAHCSSPFEALITITNFPSATSGQQSARRHHAGSLCRASMCCSIVLRITKRHTCTLAQSCPTQLQRKHLYAYFIGVHEHRLRLWVVIWIHMDRTTYRYTQHDCKYHRRFCQAWLACDCDVVCLLAPAAGAS